MRRLQIVRYAVLLFLVFILNACTVKYSFNAGSIDYSKYSSISIIDFPNNAELVSPMLSQNFTESLRDKFTRQTKLSVIKDGGDMHIEGEIVGYNLQAMAISADSYAAETKLTLTINVRFSDSKNPENDFDNKSYSANQLFESSKLLSDVEEQLLEILIKEIVDNIYNDTVARW